MSCPEAEDIKFIEEDLLPEMVHNRCFCEEGSREFVELDSAKIKPLKRESHHLQFSLYQADVVVSFSGEPQTFHLLVKLLPEDVFGRADANLELAYDGFLNEEIMWNKARLQYGRDFFPKFYVADMGKYGRPVVVVEDLEKNGYYRVKDREFSMEEGKAVLEWIGRFHGKGMALKENKFTVFREFFAKFQEITFAAAGQQDTKTKYAEFIEKVRFIVMKMDDEEVRRTVSRVLTSDPYAKCKLDTQRSVDKTSSSSSDSNATICHGLLLRENLYFKKVSEGEKTQVRALDWQRVRHASSTIDLATILSQCRFYDWKFLMQDYVKAVQKEHSTIDKVQLEMGLGSPGFLHAFLLLSLVDEFELPPLVILYSVFAYDFNEN